MGRLNLKDTEVYKHSTETRKLALRLDADDVAEWLLTVGYYPEAYVLPPFFKVARFELGDRSYEVEPDKKGKTFLNPDWSESVKLSYPSDGLTSRVFSVIDPHHYHDLVSIIRDNYALFVNSYKADRIFSFTFPIPVDSQRPGSINPKRSERQIYEYIDAAEKKLLVDAADYKFVVVADIKRFYPSIYTHSISWAIHTKKLIRSGKNKYDYNLIGNQIDKLIQCSNDGRTNGIAIGPAVSDVISEWVLNVVDVNISRSLPGRAFGIRFKDDYRVACDTEEEAKQIIETIQKQLGEFDLSLSEEKTSIQAMPDGLYRPWMLEYDHFAEALLGDIGKREKIPFRKYQMLQRKVFDMNKEYSAKGVAEKFLGKLVSDDYKLMVKLQTPLEKKMVVANMIRLVGQKPKVIGQVLGIFELILDEDTTPIIQEKLAQLWRQNNDNEFMLCWLFYFMKKNGLKTERVDKKMPLLLSMDKDSQAFYLDTSKDIQLVTHMKDIEVSISEHVALFKKGVVGVVKVGEPAPTKHRPIVRFIQMLMSLCRSLFRRG